MQSAVIVPVVLNANGVVSIPSCDNLPHYCSAFISFKFNLGFLLSAMMAEQWHVHLFIQSMDGWLLFQHSLQNEIHS